MLGANTTAVQMAAPVRKILDPPTYGAIGEIMDVVNELGKCALLDMYEK